MTLEQFNKQFIYQEDIKKYGFFEVWDIPELQSDGKYYGDCEDYCIFLKHNVEDFEDYDYYYCTLNGVGHCVLMKNNYVIDCNIQKVIKLEDYKKIYNISNLKKYNWFTILSKFIFGKIIKIVKGK